MEFDKNLHKQVIGAMKNAYAPYSNFLVGALIVGSDGNVYTGCNVENAAYPIGSCAEAGAISAMVLNGCKEIAAIYVIGKDGEPVTPCGGCRQRIREFAKEDCPIFICDINGLKLKTTLAELLPISFGPDHLN